MSTLELPRKNVSKGSPVGPLLTDHQSMQVGPRSAAYYEACKEWRVFIGNGTADVTPIFSNTAQKYGLWNPLGSGVNAVLARITVTIKDTTGAAGGYVLGASIGTGGTLGGLITAFTAGTVYNGLLGAGRTPLCSFTATAATVTAPILYQHLGLNQLVITYTDATNGLMTTRLDFNGDVVIPPGNAIWFAGSIATLSKVAPCITCVEEDQ